MKKQIIDQAFVALAVIGGLSLGLITPALLVSDSGLDGLHEGFAQIVQYSSAVEFAFVHTFFMVSYAMVFGVFTHTWRKKVR